ncbi:5-oxoprolinase subunit PxpA [Leucothrix mucor]|uniref:5-oxoprolinase subunit PxpA n=1 Tax=Leucothrix mucor TaxID=45248 RepID=UPI0003B4EE0E|nr:5-oxoprolinase subunit PxpA [Leucothrix mucor]
MTIKLNCDLGESFGSWKMGMDESVMPHINQANIACGYHAGDPMIMRRTLKLAKENGVSIGAHPAYPDLNGFGRRSMLCSSEEIISYVQYQISALEGMALNLGMTLDYVKPHGALYNDMMAKQTVRSAIMEAVAEHNSRPALMLQATPEHKQHLQEASQFELQLHFEAFADRCYDDDGKLLSRTKPGAVHTREKMMDQVRQLVDHGTVTTVSGHTLPLLADTLCVHGDNDAGVQAIADIKALLLA